MPDLSYAAWEAEARHLLRLPPNKSTAAELRRVIRAAGPGSGRGAAPFGARSGALMPHLLEHYERARQAAIEDLRCAAERHLQHRMQTDEARLAGEVGAWDRSYQAAVRSRDITLIRSVWRASEPFKLAVAGQRAELRQAALGLGFSVEPKLFGASAMSIATREIQQARQNSEMIPSAVPHFMETVLARMATLHAAEAEGVFRVPGDTALLTAVAEQFESGDLVDASDPRCAHVSVYDWANLLTRWMRQLAEPLVPNDHRYEAAVELGRAQLQEGWGEISDAHTLRAQELLDSLPIAHKAIILRLVRFLRHLDTACTGMSFAALAVVFAPSLMRHPVLTTAVANAHAEAAFLQLLLTALPEMQPEYIPFSQEEEQEEEEEVGVLGNADDLTMFAKTHSSEASPQITALESPREPGSRNRGISHISFVSDPDEVDGLETWSDPLMPALSASTPGSRIDRDRLTTDGSSHSSYGLGDVYEEPVDRSPAYSDVEPELADGFWNDQPILKAVREEEAYLLEELAQLDNEAPAKVDSVRAAEQARRARLATAEMKALREEETYLLAELAKMDNEVAEKENSVRDAESARRARLATAELNVLLETRRERLSTRELEVLRAEEQWLVEEIARLQRSDTDDEDWEQAESPVVDNSHDMQMGSDAVRATLPQAASRTASAPRRAARIPGGGRVQNTQTTHPAAPKSSVAQTQSSPGGLAADMSDAPAGLGRMPESAKRYLTYRAPETTVSRHVSAALANMHAPYAPMRTEATAASAARMANILGELQRQQDRRINAELDQNEAEAELQHTAAAVDAELERTQAAIESISVKAPASVKGLHEKPDVPVASVIKEVGWSAGVSVASVRASAPPARPVRRARIPGGGAKVPTAAVRIAGPQPLPTTHVPADARPVRSDASFKVHRATTFNFVRAMESQKLLDPVRGEQALVSRKELRRGRKKVAPPTRRRAPRS